MDDMAINLEKTSLQKYKNKVVLVTGHTGFKGSWLCIWLLELGAKVIGVSIDPNTKSDNYVVTELSNKIIDLRCDIRDLGKLKKIFEEYKPEVVFHLAAQPLVRLSYENPVETYDTNIMGTINVLECIRNSDSAEVGVIITSDKCYENSNQIWSYRECDRLGGHDPYSSSKACSEIVTSSYIECFFSSNKYKGQDKFVATVRAGNVIGGGDWSKDRIIPDIIRALENNKPIEIRNPMATRPWQHVLEPLRGYLLLGEYLMLHQVKYVGAWNFGPYAKDILSVEEIAKKTIDIWGEGSYKIVEKNGPYEAQLLSIDHTKAMRYLNWKPIISLDNALKMTIDWYKNYKYSDMYNFCVEQIKSIEAGI